MSSYILDLIPFRKKKHKLKLTADGKHEVAKTKVTEAFIMFQQAQDALDEANALHNEAAEIAQYEEEQLEIQLLEKRKLKQKALTEIHLNEKLSKKLQDFLV